MSSVYDVVVVGYGPVGQALTALLGRSGHRVLALERHPSLFGMPRAGHVDDEIMRMLQRLGLAEELERVFQPATEYQMLSGDGAVLFEIHGGDVGRSGWRSDYTMPQPELETALDRVARACPGVEVRQGVDVIGLTQDQHGVTVRLRTADGAGHDTQEVRAHYVVGADGANSVVRESLGITRTDFGFEASWLVLDVSLNDPDRVLIDSVDGSVLVDGRQWCDPTRPISAFRWIGRSRSRWEIMLVPGDDAGVMEKADFHWRFLERWGVTAENARVTRHAVYTFRSLLADSWRQSRVLLAGDSAHSMPPFLGQGLCSGFRDAVNLAGKLDLVLTSGADPSVLDSYELERSPHARTVIALSMAIGASVCELDVAAAAARDARLLAGNRPPPPVIPPLREGILHRPGGVLSPGAGTLSVQGRAATHERTALLDDLVGPGWQLIVNGPLSLTERHRALLDRLDARVVRLSRGGAPDALVDVDVRYAEWFAELGATAVLVRPDFYVFGSAASHDAVPQLLDDLAEQLPGVLSPVPA